MSACQMDLNKAIAIFPSLLCLSDPDRQSSTPQVLVSEFNKSRSLLAPQTPTSTFNAQNNPMKTDLAAVMGETIFETKDCTFAISGSGSSKFPSVATGNVLEDPLQEDRISIQGSLVTPPCNNKRIVTFQEPTISPSTSPSGRSYQFGPHNVQFNGLEEFPVMEDHDGPDDHVIESLTGTDLFTAHAGPSSTGIPMEMYDFYPTESPTYRPNIIDVGFPTDMTYGPPLNDPEGPGLGVMPPPPSKASPRVTRVAFQKEAVNRKCRYPRSSSHVMYRQVHKNSTKSSGCCYVCARPTSARGASSFHYQGYSGRGCPCTKPYSEIVKNSPEEMRRQQHRRQQLQRQRQHCPVLERRLGRGPGSMPSS